MSSIIKSAAENREDMLKFYEILRTLTGLSQCDFDIYIVMLRIYEKSREPLTVSELTQLLGKSRSAIERTILKLHKSNFIERRQTLSRSGGYTYVYYPRPLEEIKKMLQERLDEFYKNAKEMIMNLENVISESDKDSKGNGKN